MLMANNITKFDLKNNSIISNMSINVNIGDCVSIIGPSGSGKSTFLSILSGLIKYDKGNILYNNKNFNDYDIFEYRKNIRYIGPKAEFFSGTVNDHFDVIFKFLNIEKKESLNIFLSLLNDFSLNEEILKRDTNDVSTGEGKRLLIIQNLLIKAPIYVLDESLSGLDPVLMEKVFFILKDISQALIITSHDIDFLSRFTKKSIFISNGTVLESTNDFFKDTSNVNIINFINKKD